MQFQVPQFIETEDKIIGPLTLRQFLYLAAAGFIAFLLFFILKLWLWFFIVTILAVIAASLAFIKYNGRSLSSLILSAFRYFWQPRLYLWQRTEVADKLPPMKLKVPSWAEKPSSEEKAGKPLLKNLWLRLTTSTRALTKKVRPRIISRPPKEKFEVFRKISGERDMARRVDYR